MGCLVIIVTIVALTAPSRAAARVLATNVTVSAGRVSNWIMRALCFAGGDQKTATRGMID